VAEGEKGRDPGGVVITVSDVYVLKIVSRARGAV
jgi:hypothetical protein